MNETVSMSFRLLLPFLLLRLLIWEILKSFLPSYVFLNSQKSFWSQLYRFTSRQLSDL